MKRQLSDLSDDDADQPAVVVGPGQPQEQAKAEVLQNKQCSASAIRTRLGKLSSALCGCARHAKRTSAKSCFKQFHGGGMEAVFQLVWKFQKLAKFDMDCQVPLKSNLDTSLAAIYILGPIRI